MKKIISRHSFWILSVLLCAAPYAAQAASLSFVPSQGQTTPYTDVTLQVRLNTEGSAINAADGSVLIPAGLQVTHITTGGSGFSLWPTEPQFTLSNGSIVFAGGVPGGISPGQNILLFTVVLHATSTGEYSVSSQNVSAYKNDGNGTRIAVANTVDSITVNENAQKQPVKTFDTKPPHFVYATVGSDPSLFGGKFYVSFFAQDDQSGVTLYEIKEGWFAPYVVADKYYVLRDQTLSSDISVRAIDAAGNSVITVIPATHRTYSGFIVGGGILLIALLVLYTLRRRRKNRRRYEI